MGFQPVLRSPKQWHGYESSPFVVNFVASFVELQLPPIRLSSVLTSKDEPSREPTRELNRTTNADTLTRLSHTHSPIRYRPESSGHSLSSLSCGSGGGLRYTGYPYYCIGLRYTGRIPAVPGFSRVSPPLIP